MIKVIRITGDAWESHKINPNKDPNLYYWCESPVLEKFINEGWTIKDWKMAKSKNGTDWTFIMEKNNEENE